MRITEKDLKSTIARINEACGTPAEPYTGREPQGNSYHLSCAYGGYSLHQMMPSGTGVKDVFNCGHVQARELYDRMWSFLAGIETGYNLKGE